MGDSLMHPVQPHVNERGVAACQLPGLNWFPWLIVGMDPAEIPQLCPEVVFLTVGWVLAFETEVQSITPSLLSKLLPY